MLPSWIPMLTKLPITCECEFIKPELVLIKKALPLNTPLPQHNKPITFDMDAFINMRLADLHFKKIKITFFGIKPSYLDKKG